jgi:hypothetical protein
MSIMELGALGEFVGAIAIVVTLVFVLVQLRQATSAVRTEALCSVSLAFNEANLAWGTDKEVAEIVRVGVTDFDSLDATEQFQYVALYRTVIGVYWNLFQLYKIGAVPTAYWIAQAKSAAEVIQQSYGARFVANNQMYADLWEELKQYEGSSGSADFWVDSESS